MLPWIEAIDMIEDENMDADVDEEFGKLQTHEQPELKSDNEQESTGKETRCHTSDEDSISYSDEDDEDLCMSDADACKWLEKLLTPLTVDSGCSSGGWRHADRIIPGLDGSGLFPLVCKINHSCTPNVCVYFMFVDICNHIYCAPLYILRFIIINALEV